MLLRVNKDEQVQTEGGLVPLAEYVKASLDAQRDMDREAQERHESFMALVPSEVSRTDLVYANSDLKQRIRLLTRDLNELKGEVK
jgi:hypothetical protein|tara:strand:- start:15 stop:269 length:255 start_codon:yes stop_codon:yes gene_type:complete